MALWIIAVACGGPVDVTFPPAQLDLDGFQFTGALYESGTEFTITVTITNTSEVHREMLVISGTCRILLNLYDESTGKQVLHEGGAGVCDDVGGELAFSPGQVHTVTTTRTNESLRGRVGQGAFQVGAVVRVGSPTQPVEISAGRLLIE